MIAASLVSVGHVWLRHFTVFRKNAFFFALSMLAEPVLYLFAFGYGVGGLVGSVHLHGAEISYRSFVISGVVGQAVLFQGFTECSYGGFVRMYYQRIFQSIAITPITLSEVLWAELSWGTTRGTVAALVVSLIGVLAGDFPLVSPLLLLPLCVVGSLLFASMGLLTAALSKNIDHLSYPQYLVVVPMFLVCGVFYPVESLPLVAQRIAWALPLTGLNSLCRTIALGSPFEPKAIAVIAAWLVPLVVLSRRSMIRRLVK